ncbi:LuxR C-terminal-related transcriptional regulator [Azospirillum lipoferum]|nr:LuxR C-terminal-related transcriptional regulator [Azospirillum lipoferum]
MSYIDPALAVAAPVGTMLKTSDSRGRDMMARLAQLTVREVDVMVRMVASKSSEAIAVDLGLSVKTVAWYRGRVMAKLGCSGPFELGRAWEAAVWSNREKTATR